MKQLLKIFLAACLSLLTIVFFPQSSQAVTYTAADLLGQLDGSGNPVYTTNTANNGLGNSTTSAVGMRTPYSAEIDHVRHRLFVPDSDNHRILVYNLDSSNRLLDRNADYVIGQQNFTAVSSGLSAAAFFNPRGIALDVDRNRLFVADTNNNRILIFELANLATGMNASYVLGQADFTHNAQNRGLNYGTANAMGPAQSVVYDAQRNRLFVVEFSNSRVTIFHLNNLTNGMDASYVLGKPDFYTVGTIDVTRAGMGRPWGATFDPTRNRLFVSDSSNQRITAYDLNNLANGMNAAYVLGQQDFVTNSAGTTQSKLNGVRGLYYDSARDRLFAADVANSRILIFDGNNLSNGMNATSVIGQPNFTTSTTHLDQTGFNNPRGVFFDKQNGYLYVGDTGNHRTMIFNLGLTNPGLSLNNVPEVRPDHVLRFSGNSSLAAHSLTTIYKIRHAINGGGFTDSTAGDGIFDSASENFFFDFQPADHLAHDEFGQRIDGYTLNVKSFDNNLNQTESLFSFSPFVLNSPPDGTTLETSYPTFDFSVHKQRVALRDNLSHYAVQVRNRSTNEGWQTLIDRIPVDFESVKGNLENLQHSTWQSLSVTEGTYETETFLAKFTENSSRVSVLSKTASLSGSYEWRVVAVDKTGHSQETGARTLIVGGGAGSVTAGFPLAILNISGLGNPNISSYNLASIKKSYTTSSTAPTFYGIAWSGAKVTLQLTEQNCTANCTQTFSTDANFMSRWGINLPAGSLKRGKTYQTTFSVQHDQLFTQLPTFLLSVK